MRLNGPRPQATFTDALPVKHSLFREAGVNLRRGEVSLTASAPSVGKSQLWQMIADTLGVPTLYWAADMTRQDVTERTLAHVGGITVEEARGRDGSHWAAETLAKVANVEWVFEPQINEDSLIARLVAFAEVYGEYPHLLIIDTISNAVEDGERETAEQKTAMRVFQQVARETNTHVAVLAHVQREYSNGDEPIPQNGVLHNIAAHAEVMLSVYWMNTAAQTLGVNVCKNRNGAPSDPTARHPHRLKVDYKRALVLGFETPLERKETTWPQS